TDEPPTASDPPQAIPAVAASPWPDLHLADRPPHASPPPAEIIAPTQVSPGHRSPSKTGARARVLRSLVPSVWREASRDAPTLLSPSTPAVVFSPSSRSLRQAGFLLGCGVVVLWCFACRSSDGSVGAVSKLVVTLR